MRGKALAAASLVASLLLCAPTAFAAPPANDNFVDAQALAPGLPVNVSGTNVEATKEVEEPAEGFASAGHSVWFEWEATSTGFVTVGTCGSDFDTLLGVYTGASVSALTKVAGDPASIGPGCPGFDGAQVTFEATSGVAYEVAVDGTNVVHGPGGEPVVEGTIALQIDATPDPANDAFAGMETLAGAYVENGAFFVASGRGFTWNATKDGGEPSHEGDPGGASVWYSWTPPIPGSATVAVCEASWDSVFAVYTGSSVDSLTPVALDRAFPCGQNAFQASAETTYRIAVDGKFDSGLGTPAKGAFSVQVSMAILPPDTTIPNPLTLPPTVDTIPPNTTIDRTSLSAAQRRASFIFLSTEAGSTFRCKLDGRKSMACASPKTYKNLKRGPHVFRVTAVDPGGNADPSPAISRFQVAKPKAKKRGKGKG